MVRTSPRIVPAIVSAAILVTALGCQPGGSGGTSGVPTVSGSITVGGKVLNYGMVEFHPQGGRVLRSVIYPDGTYNIPNPPPGEVRVVVIPGNPPVPAASPGGSGGPPPKFDRVAVPARYEDPEQTPLRFTCTTGKQQFDIRIDVP
jgi:hypothetical protein